MTADIARIEDRIDRVAAASIEMSGQIGGIDIKSQIDAMEIAKVMALGKISIPAHLRGNPGDCWAIILLANEWRMSPIQVANKSYSVNNRIAFEASLLQGVILQRAPIKGRIKVEYKGDGDARTCRVWAVLREDAEIVEYTSPPFGKITPKNSPLWKSDPDQQLFYFSVRALCKRHFPDVLMGIFAKDELEDNPHYGPDNAKDVTDKPSVAARLTGGKGRGFNAQHVEHETNQSSAPADAGAATGPASAAPLNSSETLAPPAVSETNPAPLGTGQVPDGAGATQSSAAANGTAPPVGEERQATEPGDPALQGSDGLPEDWPRLYAQKLSEAKAPRYLTGIASKFWNGLGGWEKHKTLPHASTAIAIYDAFAEHFGAAGEEARNVILHELNAI